MGPLSPSSSSAVAMETQLSQQTGAECPEGKATS